MGLAGCNLSVAGTEAQTSSVTFQTLPRHCELHASAISVSTPIPRQPQGNLMLCIEGSAASKKWKQFRLPLST